MSRCRGGWRGGVEVVVNGVVLDHVMAQRRLRDEVRAELGLGPDELAIATVANLTPKKGYPDLMAAARLLIGRGHPVRFIAVGQGPLEEELRALHLAMGLGDRFVLLGYHPEPTRILAGCDLFAMASHYEGLPVALMEALTVGLPAVVTAVGGIPDAVTHGVEGLLVPPGPAGGAGRRPREAHSRPRHPAADVGRGLDPWPDLRHAQRDGSHGVDLPAARGPGPALTRRRALHRGSRVATPVEGAAQHVLEGQPPAALRRNHRTPSVTWIGERASRWGSVPP